LKFLALADNDTTVLQNVGNH